MKKLIVILVSVLAAILLCSSGKQRDQAESFPKKVSIYYDYAHCSWFGLKNYSVDPEEFHKYVDTCITLTDYKTLKYFKNLQDIARSSKDSTYKMNFDTWFSAIVDYGNYKDTVSVCGYMLDYDSKQLKDSSAVFYFISKIYAADKVTFNELGECFFENEFQNLDFRLPEEVNPHELKAKLQSLGYISE